MALRPYTLPDEGGEDVAERRMAALLDLRRKQQARQEYVDVMGGRAEDERLEAESRAAKDWGTEAAAGAARFGQFGPLGTVIGAGIGAGIGQWGEEGAYEQRREEGQGRIKAAARTLLDFQGPPKGLLGSGPQASSLAQQYQGSRGRRATALEDEDELTKTMREGAAAEGAGSLMDPYAQPGGSAQAGRFQFSKSGGETEEERRRRGVGRMGGRGAY